MPAISLNPDKMTDATVALYDLMCDGDWYDNQRLITFGAALCVASEREEALKNGRRVRRKSLAAGKTVEDAELIDSGAKDMVRNRLMIAVRGNRMERTKTQHRMTEAACVAWAQVRQNTAPANDLGAERVVPIASVSRDSAVETSTSAPVRSAALGSAETSSLTSDEEEPTKTRKSKHAVNLVFGGMPEAEGWADAPLVLMSRVHFRTENEAVPLAEFRSDLPYGSEVAYDEGTGLYRVDCAYGTGDEVRDFIRNWCEARGLRPKAIRAEREVRRRNLNDLNQSYLSDLCLHYAKYSQGRLRRHSTTLQFHFSDSDDLGQQVFEWVLDAASRYDDTSGVPFGAFLSERLSKWVHNLNREKYGRDLSDTELKYQRAMQEFVTAHGRKPTDVELAASMGLDIDTFRKKAQSVSTLQGLRNVSTLDTAPGEAEVALPDEARAEDRLEDALQSSLLSQVMTTSCAVDADARGKLATRPNTLGWVAWYQSLWGTKNKTELSSVMNTSPRNMNEYTSRAESRMQAQRSELAG